MPPQAVDLVLIATHVDVQRVSTEPDPYEPYRISQAMRVGDLLFVSGQAAIDEHGQLVGVGDFDAQAEQAFNNLEQVLKAGGSSLRDVAKVTIFLTDMSNFPKIVELRGKWFSEPYPADSIIQVTALALPELEIEIEAVAVVSDTRR
jgi:2-iminobutanoate/2-iminopropanoate deaminase